MTVETITPEVRRLIRTRITSVYKLEVLLLLRGDPTRRWAPADVGRAVRGALQPAHACLRDLVEDGLLAREEGLAGDVFRYAPSSGELSAAVDELSRSYEQRRVAVIELIYRGTEDKVRSFADAFRIRGEDDDG